MKKMKMIFNCSFLSLIIYVLMYITVSDISTLHLFSIGRHLTFKLLVLFWQLLDLPGIIEGAKDGKGRGRQVQTYGPLFFAVFLWFFFFFNLFILPFFLLYMSCKKYYSLRN